MNVSPRTLRAVVYGENGAALDDPAEAYHEASKAYPSFLGREVPGVARLEADPELRRIVARAVRRHPRRPRTLLPGRGALPQSLESVLRNRRSKRDLASAPLTLDHLATVLDSAYGVSQSGLQPLRTVPSGGALYPLELYVLVRTVDRLAPGIYHYDPLTHALEQLARGDLDERLRAAMVYPELVESAVVVVVTALFWRTRFKYGLRGYRFALIEAGHLMQNLLLACTALHLPAVPIGGFYDRRLETLLGINGVDESVVYGAALGGATGER